MDIFADEGLTGMKSETRDEFQRMIRMCELKQIDLIITKSISRFARNTKDALAYVRKLKLLGVGVQFEKEYIKKGLHSVGILNVALFLLFSYYILWFCAVF